jgi:hypothetical protein
LVVEEKRLRTNHWSLEVQRLVWAFAELAVALAQEWQKMQLARQIVRRQETLRSPMLVSLLGLLDVLEEVEHHRREAFLRLVKHLVRDFPRRLEEGFFRGFGCVAKALRRA